MDPEKSLIKHINYFTNKLERKNFTSEILWSKAKSRRKKNIYLFNIFQ